MRIHRIVSYTRMRELEQTAFQQLDISNEVCMETAGHALAQVVLELGKKKILFICGKGNNGADGMVAARVLQQAGLLVHILFPFPESAASVLVKKQLNWAKRLGVWIQGEESIELAIAQTEVMVDALLGIGVRFPLDDKIKTLLRVIENSRCNHVSSPYVIAVDVPSGITEKNTDVSVVLRADKTVTFHAIKKEMVSLPNRSRAGEIRVAPIGIPEDLFDNRDGYYLDANFASAIWKKRECALKNSQGSHKGNFGHAWIMGGSPGKMGALVLAALGAYQSGAGLLTASSPFYSQTELMSFLPPEVMTETISESTSDSGALDEILRNKTALLMGPGLGTHACLHKILQGLLSSCSLPSVWDADAINLLAKNQLEWMKDVRARKNFSWILTPHPKELARLLGTTVEDIQSDRIKAAGYAAEKWQATIVLKGAYTVVAHPDGRFAVNTTGGRELSKAGTGDVLAGILVGLLAASCAAWNDTFMVAALGVYLHGLAGEEAAKQSSVHSVFASDVARMLPKAMNRLSEVNQ